MAHQSGRYSAPAAATTAAGWRLERLTQPSRLFGANGIRTGADGRIYVAQVAGSQISAVHPDTGAIETISPLGGDVVAPDDLAFDEHGNIYATEISENRVSMLQPNGVYRVITGDMPVANPVTYHQGRLIAGELRMGARIMELDCHGAPRVILDNVPMANAFEVGHRTNIAANLSVGNPPGVTPKHIGPVGSFSGPMGLFAAIAGDADGALYLSADAEGSIMVIRPDQR